METTNKTTTVKSYSDALRYATTATDYGRYLQLHQMMDKKGEQQLIPPDGSTTSKLPSLSRRFTRELALIGMYRNSSFNK